MPNLTIWLKVSEHCQQSERRAEVHLISCPPNEIDERRPGVGRSVGVCGVLHRACDTGGDGGLCGL